MIILNLRQFLHGRNPSQPRFREFRKRRSGITDGTRRKRMCIRLGSPIPKARERFVGKDTHGGWEAKFQEGGVHLAVLNVGGHGA